MATNRDMILFSNNKPAVYRYTEIYIYGKDDPSELGSSKIVPSPESIIIDDRFGPGNVRVYVVTAVDSSGQNPTYKIDMEPAFNTLGINQRMVDYGSQMLGIFSEKHHYNMITGAENYLGTYNSDEHSHGYPVNIDNGDYWSIDQARIIWLNDKYYTEYIGYLEIELKEGSQQISANVIPHDLDMEAVFADLITNETLESVTDSDGKKLHLISEQWTNNIGNWDYTQGYIVRMHADDTLVIQHPNHPDELLESVDPGTEFQLTEGFHFIPYFSNFPRNAIDVFADLIENDSLYFVRDSIGRTLQYYLGQWWDGIGLMYPGESYVVRVFNDTVFTYGDEEVDSRIKHLSRIIPFDLRVNNISTEGLIGGENVNDSDRLQINIDSPNPKEIRYHDSGQGEADDETWKDVESGDIIDENMKIDSGDRVISLRVVGDNTITGDLWTRLSFMVFAGNSWRRTNDIVLQRYFLDNRLTFVSEVAEYYILFAPDEETIISINPDDLPNLGDGKIPLTSPDDESIRNVKLFQPCAVHPEYEVSPGSLVTMRIYDNNNIMQTEMQLIHRPSHGLENTTIAGRVLVGTELVTNEPQSGDTILFPAHEDEEELDIRMKLIFNDGSEETVSPKENQNCHIYGLGDIEKNIMNQIYFFTLKFFLPNHLHSHISENAGSERFVTYTGTVKVVSPGSV